MTSIVRLVFSAIGEVRSVMEKDAERYEKLSGGLKTIMEEMEIVEAHIKEKVPRGAVQEIMSRQLQDLAYDIEDFVEVLWEPGKYGRVLVALGMDLRLQQLERIDRFQKKITSLKDEWKKIIAESSEGEDTDVVDATSSALPPHEDSQPVELQGIDVPKREILELLSRSPAEEQQLRVVSIVGCHGVGKTALARAVYEDCLRSASQDFDSVAWVEASGCDNTEALLDKILQNVRADLESRKEQKNVKADGAWTTNLHNKQRLDNIENATMEAEGASTATILLNKRSVSQYNFSEVFKRPLSGLSLSPFLLNKRRDNENVTIPADGASTTNLRDILLNKRCLVFVDDVQSVRMWKQTVDACPLLIGSESRIIVTTSVRSVATACSSGSYVYCMQCLSKDDSKSLFWRNVYGKQWDPQRDLSLSFATASESIFRKCGGLPLALTTVAKHLYLKGSNLRCEHIEDVGQNLVKDYLLGKNNAAVSDFEGMRRVLRQCYDNLPDYDHRFFLLYLSIFPRGHQIKRKSLVRRLEAEGLVVNKGCRCLDELIDRCIIEPVPISNNSVVVKNCQVHDLVLEYIIEKSLDKNIVTLIQGPKTLLKGKNVASVRRLSIQSSSKERYHELEGRSAALRSLSIFNSQPFDLQSCMMLRLLDLEGSSGIDNTFLRGLCKLHLLRYLSLRNTGINEIPQQIEKLQCLETLDIRGGGTDVKKLPMKVFKLPKLAYLFGKFQLSDVPSSQAEIDNLSDFLQNRSVLQTLSGFVANKRHGQEHVILLAGMLKKVKVWCNDTAADSQTSISVPKHSSNRSESKIRWFPKRTERNRPWNRPEVTRNEATLDFICLLKKRSTTDLESVSIGSSSGLCQDFLGSLEGPCHINSIKLRGNLDRLPASDKLRELGRIKKLQLFCTGLTIKELSVLQHLRGLQYLKLVEYCSGTFCRGIFIVEKKGFESLTGLCIEAPMLPRIVFKEGSMESLTSLHLLCRISRNQPSETVEGMGIPHLARLSEVIHNSSMQMQEAWETVAKENPNRPCVKRQAE